MANDKHWRMTRPHDLRAPGCVIQRDTHRRHKRAPAKNAAKVIVNCFHHTGWRVVFHTAMMKEKLCQRGKQRRSCPVTGAVGNPEQASAVFHSQPAVNVSAYLNDRAITS